MSDKDYYSDISKNLKQQLDILKSNQPQIPDSILDKNPDVIPSDEFIPLRPANVIKINDRVDAPLKNTEPDPTIHKKSDTFILYCNIILLVLIPFVIYGIIYLIKPSYIYKSETTNKKSMIVIDYNKLYLTISFAYILILILLYLQKKKVVDLITLVKNKFFN